MTDNAFGQNQRPTEPIQSEGQPKAAQPASFDNFDDDIPFQVTALAVLRDIGLVTLRWLRHENF